MNEHEQELKRLRELEQATARPGRGAASPSSPEAAELRESWLAFGQMLDASNRSFDPARVLAGLHSSAPTTAGVTVDVATTARRGWRSLAAWGVVASLLIGALAVAWSWRDAGRSPSPQAPIARQEPSEQEPSSDDSDRQATRIAEDAATAWDDSFDEQLAATRWRLSQAGATASVSEVRYESLRQAVEQFDSELSGSSL